MMILRSALFGAATAFLLACRVAPAPPAPTAPPPLAGATQLIVVTTNGEECESR